MEEQKKEQPQQKTASFQTSPMQSFKENKEEPSVVKVLAVLLCMAMLGVGTGYAFSRVGGSGMQAVVSQKGDLNAPQKGQTFGVDDIAEFPDNAEGIVKQGGIEGEGQYHLERPGGESQNVYMTSSTVDLSKFVGKKIKVWGATQTAQKAGWLMDVGKVEIL